MSNLLDCLCQLKQSRISAIYASYKMKEIIEVVDWQTVLWEGPVAGSRYFTEEITGRGHADG